MAQRIFVLILCLFSSPVFAGLFDNQSTNNFVPASKAFQFDFQQQQQHLMLHWQIKPGFYLYKKQIKLTPTEATLGEVTFPQGESHHDEFFGDSEVYRQQLTLPVTLQQASQTAHITVTWQGCSDRGVCYPPESQDIPLSAVAPSSTPPAVQGNNPGQQTNAAAQFTGESSPPSPHAGSPFSPLWALLIGVGIAFTPCVLPMYPLVSGIIVGNGQLSQRRTLWLALLYVQGMAFTYTLLGLGVAAAGLPFQAALQSPWVLSIISAVFILLALSMFGVFSLQLPGSLQTRLALLSNRQQGGSAPGVLAMGAIAGLICSPCTTAPLSAILLYIAQSGNLPLGGLTLWCYATGMGLPLVAVAVFGRRLLPKSGPWMEQVKVAFGFVILALPVFLVSRILPGVWEPRLWGLLGVAFFSWGFITLLAVKHPAIRAVQILLLGAALVCARPLQDWVFGAPQSTSANHLVFQPVKDNSELQYYLAQHPGQPVMVDLYADWCVACKEFDKYTFSDPGVQRALKQVHLLKVDVTDNSPQNQALLAAHQVLGLPTILFFDGKGQPLDNLRVTGFMGPPEFIRHLQKLPGSTTIDNNEQ